jgi:hypothetical protein
MDNSLIINKLHKKGSKYGLVPNTSGGGILNLFLFKKENQ